MFKKISIITIILIANISLLFAQKYSVYVISPAVGNYKDNTLKENYISILSSKFTNDTNDNNNISLGKIRDDANAINAGIDALIKSSDKNSQIAGKVLKARKERFIIMVSIDELNEAKCNELGLQYEIVKLAADGIVTLTVFDKNNLSTLPYVDFKPVKLQNYEKVSNDFYKRVKKYLDKQIKQKK